MQKLPIKPSSVVSVSILSRQNKELTKPTNPIFSQALYCNHNNLCIILCIERERGFSLSEWLTSVRPQVTSESLLTSQLVFYFLPNQTTQNIYTSFQT